MEKETEILYQLFKSHIRSLTEKIIDDNKKFHIEQRKKKQDAWGWREATYIDTLSESEKYLYYHVLNPIEWVLRDYIEKRNREFHITERMYENRDKIEELKNFVEESEKD